MSFATSYFLTQLALTAIPVNSLPAAERAQISDVLETPLDTFDLIQIGKWNSESTNHSLGEFADA